MKKIKGIMPKHSFDYDSVHVNIYHVNVGEGLPKHIHNYTHCTICYNGKIKIIKENFELILTKDSQPVVLKAGEWHQIEAIENETIFSNIFASKFMSCDLNQHKEY